MTSWESIRNRQVPGSNPGVGSINQQLTTRLDERKQLWYHIGTTDSFLRNLVVDVA